MNKMNKYIVLWVSMLLSSLLPAQINEKVILSSTHTFKLSCPETMYSASKYTYEDMLPASIVFYMNADAEGNLTLNQSYPLRRMHSFYPDEDSVWYYLPKCFERDIERFKVKPLYWNKKMKGYKKKTIEMLNQIPSTRPNGGRQIILMVVSFYPMSSYWSAEIIAWESLFLGGAGIKSAYFDLESPLDNKKEYSIKKPKRRL